MSITTRKRGYPPNLEVALHHARSGKPVFPVAVNKQPLTRNGFHDATTDEAQIVRWWRLCPNALVGIPTGHGGLGGWVLDVDGAHGLASLQQLLSKLQLDAIGDLTRVIVRTPSGGFHLYFSFADGETPRNRAGDIGLGLDTRGVKADGSAAGYVIGPGSKLPDGRCYELLDPMSLTPTSPSLDFMEDASPAPRGLLTLATFNAPERGLIRADANLRQSLRDASASEWLRIMGSYRARQRLPPALDPTDATGMRAQALHDLEQVTAELSTLQDGRRNETFRAAARVGKYVANAQLSYAEVLQALREAARSNGSLQKHGDRWLTGCVARALRMAQNDPLPPLARQFRSASTSGVHA